MKLMTFGHVRLFADARAPSIDELREKQAVALASAKALQAKADGEGREMTEDESKEFDNWSITFDSLAKDIQRREAVLDREAKMSALSPRLSTPPPMEPAAPAAPAVPSRSPVTGRPVAEMHGTRGFFSMGDFALAVRGAATGRREDARLAPLAAATTQAQEAVGADGGYMVPPDFRTAIMQKVFTEDSLVGRTDRQTTSGFSINIPVDEVSQWDATNGVQAYWEGEGTQFSQSKLQLRSVSLRANKLAALLPVTDELLADAPSLTAYMSRRTAQKIDWKINDALVNGDGVMKPLGLLNCPCKVTQAAEGSQTADTINFQNIVKMWSRMAAPNRRNAIWIANQDIEPQLAQMVISSGSSVSFPAYFPASQGLLGNNFSGTLMGRPIVFTEAAAALGDEGDIILADLTQYITLTQGSGLQSDSSIHLWFDYGLTAFRFTLRFGGMHWWSSAITRNKGNSVSSLVTLAAR